MNYENQSNVLKKFPFRTKQKIRTLSFELLSSNVFTIRTKRHISKNHFHTIILLVFYKVGFEHPYKETYAIYEKFSAFLLMFKGIFKNILTYFYLYSLSMS